MTNKKRTSFPYIALLAFGFWTTSCNKPYTPPEMIGTWHIGAPVQGNMLYSYVDANSEIAHRIENLYFEGLISEELQEKLHNASVATAETLEELRTVSFSLDGTFTLTFDFQPSAYGTFTQDGSYLYFTCETNHYPEVEGKFLGMSDGTILIIYPSSLTLMPLFLPYLTEEEIELVFGTANPNTGLEGAIYFSRSNP